MRRAMALMLVGSVAAAETPESTKLFEEGRSLGKDGNWAEACDKFEKSLELDPAVGTQLNYADCHEHLGHLAQAWRLFDAAATASDKEHNAERGKYARQRAAALLLKVGTVVVKLATPNAPGLTVTIAGRMTKPAAEIRDIVDPGDVTVEIGAPNMDSIKKSERVDPGKTVVFEIPPLGEIAHPGPTTVRRQSRVITAYTVGGIGAVSLVGGIALGLVAKGRYEEQFTNGNCSEGARPQCHTADGYAQMNNAIAMANVGTVLGIGGLVLVGAGAVIFFTAPRDIVVTPTASAEAAGLAVVGRF